MTVCENLTQARSDAVDRVIQSSAEQTFTGLVGEADVGKTALLTAALERLQKSDWTVVRLDLDGAWSPNRLAWRWARELMRAVAGSVVLSHLDALDPGMWPESTRKALLRLPEQLGYDVAHLAEARQPARGVGKAAALDTPVNTTLDLASRRQLVLVIDHLEAPRAAGISSPDPAELLWRLRSRGQYLRDLHLLVCTRPPARDLAGGPKAAYHMDGRWLTIDVPTARDFSDATGHATATVEAVVSRTGGHPRATLELLSALPDSYSSTPTAIDATIARIADRHADLTRRYMQHARSVHRLGGHLLLAIAQGSGPYEATPEIDGSEVSHAMTRLHLNGLVRRVGPREWAPADPRVSWALGSTRYRDLAASYDGERAATNPDSGPSAEDPRSHATPKLTRREQQVLDRILSGYSPIQIAEDLEISPHTVRHYLRVIYQAFGVTNQVQLFAAAGGSRRQDEPL